MGEEMHSDQETQELDALGIDTEVSETDDEGKVTLTLDRDMVQQLCDTLKEALGEVYKAAKNKSKIIESKLLSLNCEKAKEFLNWTPTLSFDEMSEFTISWYKTYYSNKKRIKNLTYKQIKDFMSKF